MADQKGPEAHIRGINPEVWRAMRAESVRRGLTVAKLIEELWADYQRKRPVYIQREG